jgi:Tol biopolymer transport system component
VIALIAPDGGQERILTRGEAPRWSPAGGRLLYAREAAGEIAVFHAAPDGSARRRVRLGPVRRYEKGPFLLRWSQTGRRLVYLRASDGIEPRTAIFSARRDGSHQQLVRRFPPNAEVALAVSPESGQIAFTERRGARFLLRLMRANGTRVRTILTRPLSAEHVAPPAQLDYSPDGGQIAFDGDGIWAVDVDGTAVRRLHPHGGHPAWSPDGRKLAFVVIRHQPGDGLQVMNADGTDRRTIREGFDVESVDWQPVI